jgi:hypothetical protein
MRKHSHLVFGTVLLALLGTTAGWSQQPPPPPAGALTPIREPEPPPAPPQPLAAPSTVQQPVSSKGTIRSWNYGPNGDINGFTLDRDVLVMLPPDFAATLANMAKLGSRISVSGYDRSGVNVQTVVEARSVTVNGHTMNVGATAGPPLPYPPPGPAARGRARRGPPPPPPAPGALPAPPQL